MNLITSQNASTKNIYGKDLSFYVYLDWKKDCLLVYSTGALYEMVYAGRFVLGEDQETFAQDVRLCLNTKFYTGVNDVPSIYPDLDYRTITRQYVALVYKQVKAVTRNSSEPYYQGGYENKYYSESELPTELYANVNLYYNDIQEQVAILGQRTDYLGMLEDCITHLKKPTMDKGIANYEKNRIYGHLIMDSRFLLLHSDEKIRKKYKEADEVFREFYYRFHPDQQ